MIVYGDRRDTGENQSLSLLFPVRLRHGRTIMLCLQTLSMQCRFGFGLWLHIYYVNLQKGEVEVWCWLSKDTETSILYSTSSVPIGLNTYLDNVSYSYWMKPTCVRVIVVSPVELGRLSVQTPQNVVPVSGRL